MTAAELKFPKHLALTLEHNPHKTVYDTVQQWEQCLRELGHEEASSPLQLGWVSVEQRNKAIAQDSVWELHWYPETPVGFNRLFACDLDALFDAISAEAEASLPVAAPPAS